jgi:hypothetical protein
LAALRFIPRLRHGCSRELGRGGDGSGQLGNRKQYPPAISEHDTEVLKILVRQVLQNRKIDSVFGKAVRILG